MLFLVFTTLAAALRFFFAAFATALLGTVALAAALGTVVMAAAGATRRLATNATKGETENSEGGEDHFHCIAPAKKGIHLSLHHRY
ncbi:MAG: hypothetical protein AAF085_11300 [Planctomycetota bacterium]